MCIHRALVDAARGNPVTVLTSSLARFEALAKPFDEHDTFTALVPRMQSSARQPRDRHRMTTRDAAAVAAGTDAA